MRLDAGWETEGRERRKVQPQLAASLCRVLAQVLASERTQGLLLFQNVLLEEEDPLARGLFWMWIWGGCLVAEMAGDALGWEPYLACSRAGGTRRVAWPELWEAASGMRPIL
jgi:hypothetical protein